MGSHSVYEHTVFGCVMLILEIDERSFAGYEILQYLTLSLPYFIFQNTRAAFLVEINQALPFMTG